MSKDLKLKIVGVIPARYGSSRFPGKPLAEINGKTLIQLTFENAKRCSLLSNLIVATDDQRIQETVSKFGGNTVLTSENCATGTDRIAEVLDHNNALKTSDIIVNIQGDEPCLEPEVMESVVKELILDPSIQMATAASKIHSREDLRNPHIVKCVVDLNHHAIYFSRSPIPSGDGPSLRHIGIYAYRKDFLKVYTTLPKTPLQLAEDLEQLKVIEHGYKIKVAVVESKSIGVDTPEDLDEVKKLLCIQNTSSLQAESAPL